MAQAQGYNLGAMPRIPLPVQRAALLGLLVVGLSAAAAPPPGRQALLRRALPKAARFEHREFAAAALPPEDRGNAGYWTVADEAGQILGYARDFTGPVSPQAGCPCSPLDMTLVFDAERRLLDIVSESPLQKWGHQALSSAEHARLIKLAQDPPPALVEVAQEDMVDVSTGATRHALDDVVIARAALTTRRVVGLVQETQRLLAGAPLQRDRARLQDILAHNEAPMARARSLAALQGEVTEPDAQRATYQAMVAAYVLALGQDPRGDGPVERRLLQPNLAAEHLGDELTRACTRLADRGLRPQAVERCIRRLTAPGGLTVAGERLALLLGTALFNRAELAAALPHLRVAARGLQPALQPLLFVRLIKALDATGARSEACGHTRSLYMAHPLLPEARALLALCGGPGAGGEALRTAVEAEMRARLLARDRGKRGPKAPELSLTDRRNKALEVALTAPGQITVVVFFATWCPHCRSELPRLRQFVAALPTQPFGDQVRVLGIRTATEREAEPYDAFLRAFSPNFSIFTDGPRSVGLTRFVEGLGLAAALPTTAVIDQEGFVRFVLIPGDFADTAAELSWIAAHLRG